MCVCELSLSMCEKQVYVSWVLGSWPNYGLGDLVKCVFWCACVKVIIKSTVFVRLPNHLSWHRNESAHTQPHSVTSNSLKSLSITSPLAPISTVLLSKSVGTQQGSFDGMHSTLFRRKVMFIACLQWPLQKPMLRNLGEVMKLCQKWKDICYREAMKPFNPLLCLRLNGASANPG